MRSSQGRTSVILAPTAGGKTESAISFPIISQMLTEWVERACRFFTSVRFGHLLNNREQRLQKYFTLVGRRAACWHGDTTQGDKRRSVLADSPDCLPYDAEITTKPFWCPPRLTIVSSFKTSEPS